MLTTTSIEYQECVDYLRRSTDEGDLQLMLQDYGPSTTLIVTQGFEERSVGVIETFANSSAGLGSVVISRYPKRSSEDINAAYESRFECAAERIAPSRWSVVENDSDGRWVREAVTRAPGEEVVFDITGVSNRGLFPALDALAHPSRKVSVAYAEAGEYWPKEGDWTQLRRRLAGHQTLAELVGEAPWLFGYNHRVELVPRHEGYDSAVAARALIGFLPFKCARLAAVLGEEDYADCVFIAGRPRLPANRWRLDALQDINREIVKDWPVITMPTFGYRAALRQFSDLLFKEQSLLERYNVHLAILGSKLQGVACWILSAIVPSITVVTSIPLNYYHKAFSDGIGAKWIFRLEPPTRLRLPSPPA